MTSTAQPCCICHEVLNVSKHSLSTIKELLKILIGNINSKLLEESAICDICLAKIQSAYKFKNLYLNGLRKTLTDVTVKEETDLEKCNSCEICKTSNQIDYIPLFDSVTGSGFNLIEYLSVELESKIQENSLTCETCHKSLINFYEITNLLTVFNPNYAVSINESYLETEEKEIQRIDNDLICESSNENLKGDFKVELDSPLVDLKKEKLNNFHEEFVLKSDEVDLKMESDDDTQLVRQQNENKATETTSPLNRMNINAIEAKRVFVNIFKCHSCEFKTRYKSSLKNHMLVHSNDVEMFKCQNCEYETKYKSCLKKHTIVHKNSDEVKLFKCHNCQHKTHRKDLLKRHINRVHQNSPNLETLKCQICTYETKYKCNLQQHMLTHKSSDEVEMFKCQSCDFETKYKNYLKKHLLVHKKPDEVKMFLCEICEYQTKHKSNLKDHMLVHKPSEEVETFKCQRCEFKTRRKKTLSKHMILHKSFDEVEMFKCQSCEYQTKHKNCIKRHILTHNNTQK